jgi:hypothetical protein
MSVYNLKLTIFEAFLGAINDGLRAISFDYNDEKIVIYGYYDREPNDEDYEVIDIAVTEILASNPHFQNQEIILKYSNEPRSKLNFHKGLVFLRYEE